MPREIDLEKWCENAVFCLTMGTMLPQWSIDTTVLLMCPHIDRLKSGCIKFTDDDLYDIATDN